MKIVFINCRTAPYIDLMVKQQKPFETRTRNMLRAVVGERVMLAETGKGRPPLCTAIAEFGEPIVVRSREEWEQLRPLHCVPAGSQYDWKPETTVKHLYPVTAKACKPFTAPEGVRHGRVWMESII